MIRILLTLLGVSALCVNAAAHHGRGEFDMDNVVEREGTVEPGKIADIILIDGDPLAEISDLMKVQLVIQGGASGRRQSLRERRDRFHLLLLLKGIDDIPGVGVFADASGQCKGFRESLDPGLLLANAALSHDHRRNHIPVEAHESIKSRISTGFPSCSHPGYGGRSDRGIVRRRSCNDCIRERSVGSGY